jgi:drug/metabolite transporter (DMT)-like permease
VRVRTARGGARLLGSAYMALAALAWSLAGILQRQLHMGLATQLAGRAVFASVAVFVFASIAERGRVITAFRAIGRPGLAIAALMAVSSGSFISALNATSVANVMVVQALVPLVTALLGLLAGEPVRRRTWAAMAVAVAGLALMAGSPDRPGPAGLAFSLLAMLTYATTIVVARHRAEVSMAPATCLSQVLVFAVFAPFAHVSEISGAAVGYLALMGVVQMGLALFFLSLGARLIPAAEAALISQMENVLGPLWVWLAGLERPSAVTVAGGVVVIGAVAFQVTQGSGPPPGDLPPGPATQEAVAQDAAESAETARPPGRTAAGLPGCAGAGGPRGGDGRRQHRPDGGHQGGDELVPGELGQRAGARHVAGERDADEQRAEQVGVYLRTRAEHLAEGGGDLAFNRRVERHRHVVARRRAPDQGDGDRGLAAARGLGLRHERRRDPLRKRVQVPGRDVGDDPRPGQCLDEQLLLGAEVPHDQAVGDAGPARDLPNGRAGVAALVEDLARRLQDRRARRLRVTPAPGAGGCWLVVHELSVQVVISGRRW